MTTQRQAFPLAQTASHAMRAFSRCMAACAIGVACQAAAAKTIMFDFDDVPLQGPIGSLSVTRDGFTISIEQVSFRVFDFGAPLNRGLQDLGTGVAFLINFSAAVSSVSLDFYDFGSDEDTGELHGYSGLNGSGLLASDTGFLPSGPSGPVTLDTMTVSGAGLRSVRFDALGISGQSVIWDNLSVTLVPEPPVSVLVGLGLFLLAAHRRLKARAS